MFKRVLFGVILATLLTGSVQAAEPAGAADFVRSIYRHYPAPEGGPYFDPTGDGADRYLDASLVTLLRRAQAASNGEVISGLDADHFCQCQDDGGLSWRLVSVTATDATHATAVVSLSWEPRHANPRQVRLLLTRTPQGWRVSDIRGAEGGSWRSDLEQGIREAREAAAAQR